MSWTSVPDGVGDLLPGLGGLLIQALQFLLAPRSASSRSWSRRCASATSGVRVGLDAGRDRSAPLPRAVFVARSWSSAVDPDWDAMAPVDPGRSGPCSRSVHRAGGSASARFAASRSAFSSRPGRVSRRPPGPWRPCSVARASSSPCPRLGRRSGIVFRLGGPSWPPPPPSWPARWALLQLARLGSLSALSFGCGGG